MVYAALLFAMALGIRRRLRSAWWFAFSWLLLLPQLLRLSQAMNGTATWAAWVGLVVMTPVAAMALRARPLFTVRAVRGNVASALGILLFGSALTTILGTGLVRIFGNSADFSSASVWVLDLLLGELGRFTSDSAATAPLWVSGVVGLAGAVTILGSAYQLFRAPTYTRTLDSSDEAKVRILLRSFGEQDSLGYFATRRDKAAVWDSDDPLTSHAGISYHVFGSVCLASGDPLGDPARWPQAIATWRELALQNGWSVAVMGAGRAGADAYRRAGLAVFDIGDEAIIDFATFGMNGPRLGPVHHAAKRLRNAGYSTRVTRHAHLSTKDFDELAAAAAAWRGDGGDERGFSMALGRIGDALDGDCVLVTARDSSGRLRGFLSFVPWGRDALSLDLMRRDPTAANGVVELLVTSLAQSAQSFGITRASLNFAMFREAFERGSDVGASPGARLWRQALLLASRNWQLESLYRSNAKYLPQWQPRFVCFEHTSDLPRVGVAAGSAEGFLERPTLRLFRRKATGAHPLSPSGGPDHAAAVLADITSASVTSQVMGKQPQVPDQLLRRSGTRELMIALGVDPYPVEYPRTHTLDQAREVAHATAVGAVGEVTVAIAARVLRIRDHGGLCFATLADWTGQLQVLLTLDRLGVTQMAYWRRFSDIGDHVGCSGQMITTGSGEVTLRVDSFEITGKSLRPLPDKRRGLVDPESRVRARHVDLIVNGRAREVANLRATVFQSVRDFLRGRGFIEVETPILQVLHGGANARPFQTHINAYDLDLYLRIATELHLKRLVIAGMEKVFEIGKQFRNEGADFHHNPEFTSLEVYQAYSDYRLMADFTRELIQTAATAVHGAPVAIQRATDGTGIEVDISGTWPVVPISTAVSEALGEPVSIHTPVIELRAHVNRLGLDQRPDSSAGSLLEALYSHLCEGQVTSPVFFIDFPLDNAPLTRGHRDQPGLAEKWDLVMFGSELATAYTELTDPVEQRERLLLQSALATGGDPDAMRLDEDFLAALEIGMPPTGGMGLGMDRLVMNLAGVGIRDTILFPLVKPRT